MRHQSQTRCQHCHSFKAGQAPWLALTSSDEDVSLTLADKKITVPQLRHPVHGQYDGKVACAVCHASWSYSDQGTHLFRQDDDNFEPWEAISVQGSYEVEEQVYLGINVDDSTPPTMTDKLNGASHLGLWHKGFELRRWEFPIFCRDEQGTLQVCRPILDLHLSWVDEESELVMDNVKPEQAPAYGLLPYTPHTMGKAGPFYRQRLQENLHLLDYPLNLDKGPDLNPAISPTP